MKLRHILEALIMASAKPLSLDRLTELLREEWADMERIEIQEAIQDLQASYQDHALELTEVAGGYRFQVRTALAHWVARLHEEKPQKYSRALLETLAIIAYRQPITRGDIEDIRGVAVNSQIVRTLQERDWIRVVGHKEVPGRPALLATTRQFLDYFNLKSLDQLPPLADLQDIESIEKMLDLQSGEATARKGQDTDPDPAEKSDSNNVAPSENASTLIH